MGQNSLDELDHKGFIAVGAGEEIGLAVDIPADADEPGDVDQRRVDVLVGVETHEIEVDRKIEALREAAGELPVDDLVAARGEEDVPTGEVGVGEDAFARGRRRGPGC